MALRTDRWTVSGTVAVIPTDSEQFQLLFPPQICTIQMHLHLFKSVIYFTEAGFIHILIDAVLFVF